MSQGWAQPGHILPPYCSIASVPVPPVRNQTECAKVGLRLEGKKTASTWPTTSLHVALPARVVARLHDLLA